MSLVKANRVNLDDEIQKTEQDLAILKLAKEKGFIFLKKDDQVAVPAKKAETPGARKTYLRSKDLTRDHFKVIRQHILEFGKTVPKFDAGDAHYYLKKNTIFTSIKKEQVVGQVKYMHETSEQLNLVEKGERLGKPSTYSVK